MNVAQIIEQAVVGLGYEFVDLETSPRGRLLRVFIDTGDARRGVSVDDCAAVSNHLTRLFAVENVDYDRLEVSSPGLDRPLKRLADFARFAGERAHLRTRLPIDGQRNFAVRIVEVADGRVCLATERGELRLDLDQIERARLVPDVTQDLKGAGERR